MKLASASINRHLMMGLAAVVLAGAGQARVVIAGEGKVVFADDFEALHPTTSGGRKQEDSRVPSRPCWLL